MLFFSSDDHRQHHAFELSRGQLLLSTESPDRAEKIQAALLSNEHHQGTAAPLDRQLLARIHAPEYLEFLETAWPRWAQEMDSQTPAMAISWPERSSDVVRPQNLLGQLGYHSFGADCSIVSGTWAAASSAAALAQSAADAVLSGERAAYALCRPPGHHATRDQFGGYCYLNNSAIAAQRLLDQGHKSVAIIDLDYHHGNGTQSIFYARPDVLTISLHANPLFEFPFFSGHACETGAGPGLGYNINFPLDIGAGRTEVMQALKDAMRNISEFGASALVVALGVDGFVDDPLGTFTLTTQDFSSLGQAVETLSLPTVIAQEGGYATEAIGDNVAAFLAAF